MTDALAIASQWTALANDYLRIFWREMALVAAMVVASGLLFWRLGERSRHADQELVLELEALPLTDALIDVSVHDQIARESMGRALPIPVDVMLAETPHGQGADAQPSVEEPLLLSPHVHRFATLREAVEAMKADMPQPKRPREPTVSV